MSWVKRVPKDEYHQVTPGVYIRFVKEKEVYNLKNLAMRTLYKGM